MEQVFREKLELANKYIFVRKYEEADRTLMQCLLVPGCGEEPLVHLRRIELMSLLGRLPELRQSYIKKYSATGTSPFSIILMAVMDLFAIDEVGTRSHEDIVQDLQNAAKQGKASAFLFFALGYAFEQQGHFDRSKTFYEQSIAMDHEWFPSLFGLSQIHYNLGDQKLGDQYFQQFEMMAPYNVYGNFETHRKLAKDFALQGMLEESEIAIQTLTNWWVENKGFAPQEILVFENLASAQIAESRGNIHLGQEKRAVAENVVQQMLGNGTSDENILYFLARILEEFGEQRLAFSAYRRVLQVAADSPSVVQKVGGHFLSAGKFAEALELFELAYKDHPDNNEVRFCLLVSRLKMANVNVEEYLMGRERIRTLIDRGDKVELLGLLNSLNQKFAGDWDVHFHMGEIFLKMGHPGKAGNHFAKMFELDPKGRISKVRYAGFLLNQGGEELAIQILNSIAPRSGKHEEIDAEVMWLKVVYADRKESWAESQEALRPLIEKDPWNITYLMYEIINLTGLQLGKDAVAQAREGWMNKLQSGEEARVNWLEFTNYTDRLTTEHSYPLAYARTKLHYLYMRGNQQVVRNVVKAACNHDASRGARDLMRLLNTNFDSGAVYWGLGLLYKELWQLEVAGMWFEQALSVQGLDNAEKSLVYVELADTFIWRNANLPKAIEYCRLSLDLGVRNVESDVKAMTVLSHALLRQGQPRQALAFLEQLQREDGGSFEIQYLAGLVKYRNGHPQEANEIWKPLLKYRPFLMRDHKIKQEILKYYFEAEPYAPRDLSKAN